MGRGVRVGHPGAEVGSGSTRSSVRPAHEPKSHSASAGHDARRARAPAAVSSARRAGDDEQFVEAAGRRQRRRAAPARRGRPAARRPRRRQRGPRLWSRGGRATAAASGGDGALLGIDQLTSSGMTRPVGGAREEAVSWLPGYGSPVTVARPRRSRTGFPAPFAADGPEHIGPRLAAARERRDQAAGRSRDGRRPGAAGAARQAAREPRPPRGAGDLARGRDGRGAAAGQGPRGRCGRRSWRRARRASARSRPR